MKKNKLLSLLLFLLVANSMFVQLGKTIQEILTGDSVVTHTMIRNDSDLIRMANMKRELEEARLNEVNMRIEMEQLRLKAFTADFVKLAQQKVRIDSLRQFTPGVPVVVEGDMLSYLCTKRGGYTPLQRAEMTDAATTQLGKRFMLHPDSVYIENSNVVPDLMYGNKIIVSFTDQDGLREGHSREQLAADKRIVVVKRLKELKEEHSFWQLGKRILYFALVLVEQYLLFRLTIWPSCKLKVRIQKLKDIKSKPISIQDYELPDTQRQINLLIFLSNLLRYVLVFLQLLIIVPLLFVIFPQAKGLADTIFSYIRNPVKDILVGIADYISNLFTIFIIWYAIKYLVRFVHYLSREIEAGRFKFGDFYPDWTMPTFHIICFLLYASMVMTIYLYLPGSRGGALQGILVFVGLVVSLGFNAVIDNIIAGLVTTYMRPFKLGDRIQLNDTTGDVIEKVPLVTGTRTPKNGVMTIPNSFIMSSHTVNYSSSARKYGLIIRPEVTIGYDAPWRQVHRLLIEVALNIPGVIDDPCPFILETSSSDWYPVYQIDAYIREADKLMQIYSDLHQNIQDCFNEAGVEIMSLHYMAIRDGNGSTIPKDDLRPKADRQQ